MKYTEAIEINLPRQEVVALISDIDVIPKWLRGLVSHTPTNGKHGEVGTTSRVVFDTNGQEMTATETVVRQEPQDLEDLQPTQTVYYDRELEAEGKGEFLELPVYRSESRCIEETGLTHAGQAALYGHIMLQFDLADLPVLFVDAD